MAWFRNKDTGIVFDGDEKWSKIYRSQGPLIEEIPEPVIDIKDTPTDLEPDLIPTINEEVIIPQEKKKRGPRSK